MAQNTVIPGPYKHFKGNLYWAYGVARDCETEEQMVVYRALYGEGGLWLRPLDVFLSEVDHEKYPDVQQKYRFQPIVQHTVDYREALNLKQRFERAEVEGK